MQGHDAEPLPTGLWLREMMALANDCAGLPDMAEEHAMRRAYYLCLLCPLPLRSLLRPQFLETELEAFLGRGDIEQAAALIIGSGEITIVPPGDDAPFYQARYGLDDGTHATIEAERAGLAMIGAWARYFSELRKP